MPIKEVDWDKFVFRSHYFGELMSPTKGKTNLDKYKEAKAAQDAAYEKLMVAPPGPSRDKQLFKLMDADKVIKALELEKDKPTLSDTAKRRLAQIYTEETTGRVKDITNMYIEKGLKVEEDCITLYSLRTGLYYKKNRIRENNGFVSGEIDFDDEPADMTIDTKASWDIFTFDATVAKALNKIYEWQGHCYMWLKNRKKHRVAYCLINTPKEIVERLEKKLKYDFYGEWDDFEEAKELLRQKHQYEDLPINRRIRIYDVARDDEKIELAKRSIPYFREYLKNINNSKFEEDDNYEIPE